ncbi:hypothetical protein DB88DRAFT_291222 [Papiliotrema laurentii]|uniref:Uncharacterized protein n=1 Tax=Papiliotrema laurentii TaxID=5418 RepID=A0AAD9FQV2_PAPLA|nr:hypothetical protein DB88DRAFT_291222 [Papiliotrema laurentii]
MADIQGRGALLLISLVVRPPQDRLVDLGTSTDGYLKSGTHCPNPSLAQLAMADTDIFDRLGDVSILIHSFLTVGFSRLKEVVQPPQSTGDWVFNDHPGSDWDDEVTTWAEAMTRKVAERVGKERWKNWKEYKLNDPFLTVTNDGMVDFILPGTAKLDTTIGRTGTALPKVCARISGMIRRRNPIALAAKETLGTVPIWTISVDPSEIAEQSVASAQTAIGGLRASHENSSRDTHGAVERIQVTQLTHPSESQHTHDAPGRFPAASSTATDPINSAVDTLGHVSTAFQVKQEEGLGDHVELRSIPDPSENNRRRPQVTPCSLTGPAGSVQAKFHGFLFDYSSPTEGDVKQEQEEETNSVKVETPEAA